MYPTNRVLVYADRAVMWEFRMKADRREATISSGGKLWA
jgi:hypothetical protein